MRAALLAVVLLAGPARAVDFALNAGALEVVLLPPAHGGFYPYVGGSLSVLVVERLTFIAALSLEVSFDQGRGGLVAVATFDYALNERVGLDFNLAVIHDQPAFRFRDSEFFAGLGPGVSIFLGRWTVSPFVSLFAGLTAPGWSLVPGVNVARAF